MLDVLDTTEDYIIRAHKHTGFVVSFEDLGPGTIYSDIVINDLYYDPYPQDNHWYGVEYSILAPHFEALGPAPEPRPEVSEVLVTFGGSDPSRLTEKALSALAGTEHDFRVTVVVGPVDPGWSGNLSDYGLQGEVVRSAESMVSLMHRADLAITSAGRTVTELMSQAIPTTALCQNVRELLHTHASSPFGVANLGLGEHVGVDNLKSHIELLIRHHDIRLSMYRRMRKAVRGRSNERIVKRILSAAEKRLT
jgi:spore coat polysaccharide biosynthesis predicted glycosyltransferase SpsG